MSPDHPILVYLADDDIDDCYLFERALKSIPVDVALTVVHNGVELMDLLKETKQVPDIVFLDLNMPLKTGFQCLEEIKKIDDLKDVAVVILSTFFTQDVSQKLVRSGAARCIEKPTDFNVLTKDIQEVLSFIIVKKS